MSDRAGGPTTLETEADQVERARAAIAVACLTWLRCTGPTGRIEPEAPRLDRPMPDLVPVRLLPTPPEPAHPLWDRWLDGTD